jgi:hypothetical protein
MTMLTLQHFEMVEHSRINNQQVNQTQTELESRGVVFDACDRLDGNLDDTTVRQAVAIPSVGSEHAITSFRS